MSTTLAALHGCGDSGSGDQTKVHSTPAAFVNDTASEALLPTPLQVFRLTPTELAIITEARGILIDRCMRSHGFTYPHGSPAEELNTILASERVAISRRYGITDPNWAATYGYGFPPIPTKSAQAPEARQDQRYLQALHGDLATKAADAPPHMGGCAAEADLLLDAEDQGTSVYGLAHTLWIKGQARMRATKKYRNIVREWVTCLKDQGFLVTDPIADQAAIAAAFKARLDSNDPALVGPPVPGEIRLAMADTACKQAIRLVTRLDTLTATIDHRAIVRNQAALAADRLRLTRQVNRAQALTSGPDL